MKNTFVISVKEINIRSLADFVSLPTDKEMNSL